MKNTKTIHKAIRIIPATVMVLTMAGCGNKLSGTYVSTSDEALSYTFKGDKVSMKYYGLNIEGTYEIDGDEMILSIDGMESEEEEKLTYSKSGNMIELGGIEFKKK